ncbi:TetR/AcrR family transcriptional regulator [Microbacterium sp.]|uniref:TetR/AcrR family transcriptional regulator n=1 Tax=Microbacterium sp. TaxID=51671 RepID=UPI003F6FB0F7
MAEDPRTTRTRQALRDALRTLLATHSLDDVSVSLLCREAGVHRTTFYAHAPGARQFAVTEFTADLDRIATVDVDAEEETPDRVARRYLASLRALLDHLVDDRTVYRALLTSDSRGSFRAALEGRLRARAEQAIDVFADQGVVSVPDDPRGRAEAAAFIAGALVGVIDVWTLSDDTDATAAGSRIAALMPPWWPRG